MNVSPKTPPYLIVVEILLHSRPGTQGISLPPERTSGKETPGRGGGESEETSPVHVTSPPQRS